ncbi:MAG TPA: restriction endonuclease [Thermoanaerobaculia bacterium]|nr:restriction endonuclease [Thermoanaerobaculia bacterium]
MSAQLCADPSLIHQLTPDQFEELVCDRLFEMGLEPRRIGATNQRDGGIDVVFWPRERNVFPFLGAAQVKHRTDPTKKESPAAIRDFAGAMSAHPFNAGLFVSNTSFTPDAKWFARERAKLIRLRGYDDIRRWLAGNFQDEAEWREIPSTIELCPGVTIRVR